MLIAIFYIACHEKEIAIQEILPIVVYQHKLL